MLKSVNWIAVVVATIVLEVLGYVWYAVVFKAAFMAAGGGAQTNGLSQGAAYGFGVINTLIIMIGLSWLIGRLGRGGLMASVGGALAAWLFFDFTTMALDYLYQGQSARLVQINMGEQVVSYLLAGVIFGLLPAKKAS
jgi:hypothetical protein